MRCGRGSKIHEDARKMYRTQNSCQKFGKWGRRHLGGHDLVRRMDRQVPDMVQTMNETKTDGLLQAGTDGFPRVWQNVEENSSPRRWVGSRQWRQEAGGLKDRREESQEQSIRGF